MKKLRIIGRIIIEFEAEGPTKEAADNAMNRLWMKLRWAGTVISESGHPGRARTGKMSFQDKPKILELEETEGLTTLTILDQPAKAEPAIFTPKKEDQG